jgi:hypothetical protein
MSWSESESSTARGLDGRLAIDFTGDCIGTVDVVTACIEHCLPYSAPVSVFVLWTKGPGALTVETIRDFLSAAVDNV